MRQIVNPISGYVLREPVHPTRQQGAVLLIALIALVALTLAGIALVRSIDTGNVIAGNLAFKQSTLQLSDIGVEAAVSALPHITSTSLDADIPGQYFASQQPLGSNGVPSTINWNAVPPVSGAPSHYSVQYVIDRLCVPPVPVVDQRSQCASSSAAGARDVSSGQNFTRASALFYRVTVRVTGPRNTSSFVSVILSQ